jgi:peptidoglycan-associated lipoprotein
MVMRQKQLGFLIILGGVLLLSSACAKKAVVKSEELAPPAVAAKPAEPVPLPAPVKEEAVQPQPLQETKIAEAPVKEEAKPVQAEVVLARIAFDFDSYILSPPARETLKKNAELLLKNSPLKVQIEGHCDERGSDEYNLALGEKRARHAMDYLVLLGVPAGRLSIVSYGKEKPADPGHDEAAWAKNRRAEFVIIAR